MKIITDMIDFIKDEMEGAEEYIEKAIELKDKDREMADTFVKLAEVEAGHADLIHKMVVEKIKEYREREGDPPKEMEVIWDYEHKKMMEEMNEVKVKIEITKKGM